MAIYISIPISGRDIDTVKREVESIKAAHPMIEFVAPFDMKDWRLGETWEWYMARDLKMMEGCVAVLFCEGWEQSRGCRLERAWAEYLGITILTNKLWTE